jgi:hypothetical protein
VIVPKAIVLLYCINALRFLVQLQKLNGEPVQWPPECSRARKTIWIMWMCRLRRSSDSVGVSGAGCAARGFRRQIINMASGARTGLGLIREDRTLVCGRRRFGCGNGGGFLVSDSRRRAICLGYLFGGPVVFRRRIADYFLGEVLLNIPLHFDGSFLGGLMCVVANRKNLDAHAFAAEFATGTKVRNEEVEPSTLNLFTRIRHEVLARVAARVFNLDAAADGQNIRIGGNDVAVDVIARGGETFLVVGGRRVEGVALRFWGGGEASELDGRKTGDKKNRLHIHRWRSGA